MRPPAPPRGENALAPIAPGSCLYISIQIRYNGFHPIASLKRPTVFFRKEDFNMNRVYNFSAGPSMLPLPVLERAQRELLDYNGTGTSVMEMSHCSAPYMEIIARAEATLRRLAGIPDNYKGALPAGRRVHPVRHGALNLMPEGGSGDYVNSGNFANLAIKEASRFGKGQRGGHQPRGGLHPHPRPGPGRL